LRSRAPGRTPDGSPPRVWGKLPRWQIFARWGKVHPHACGENDHHRRLFETAERFTPTRVGKTTMVVGGRRQDEVHPHACGENRRGRVPAGGRVRFTPTRVGKTRRGGRSSQGRTVHPHACGENVRTTPISARHAGSPPRVWGKLVLVVVVISASRFTPTRVGKTGRRLVLRIEDEVHPHACGENSFFSRPH